MRVLLIEDDSATAKSIEMMLKSEGYICDCTDLGEDGLEIGKLYDYDLIVLDLMLPDIDGYEVLRRLRTAKVQTPILILSGLSEPDQKVKLELTGFGGSPFRVDPPRRLRHGRSAGCDPAGDPGRQAVTRSLLAPVQHFVAAARGRARLPSPLAEPAQGRLHGT